MCCTWSVLCQFSFLLIELENKTTDRDLSLPTTRKYKLYLTCCYLNHTFVIVIIVSDNPLENHTLSPLSIAPLSWNATLYDKKNLEAAPLQACFQKSLSMAVKLCQKFYPCHTNRRFLVADPLSC